MSWLRNGLALLLTAELFSAWSRGQPLWQLGTADESSGEFSHWRDRRTGRRLLDYADPAQDPVFVVGRSQPGKDWFAFQPGTANGQAGFRRHPFTIEFQLEEEPRGVYRLELALLAYSARLPLLDLSLNGHHGWYYQHPELTYTAGDVAVFYLPHYSRSLLQADFPAELLRPGTNRLVITCLDHDDNRDDAQPSGFTWPGVSGIVYDALKFERGHGPPASSGQPEVKAEPTIFYVQRGGRLLEQIDVDLRLFRWPKNGRVTLRLGGRQYEEKLPAGRDHGEARISFLVPEFPTNSQAEVTLSSDGEQHRLGLRLTPARKWELLLVPNEHLDVGYTDYAPKVADLHCRVVDQALDLMDQHPEFRFTLDGYWIAEQFLRSRSNPQQKRFFRRVREGKLSVPAVYASAFTGFASLENLIRSLYPSRKFAREQGIKWDTALITDVPSYSWSYASVLAAAGLKYFVAASDAYRAPFLLSSRLHEQSPLWWTGPDGGRVLVWYSRHYHQAASLFGLPPRLESARESLPRFLQAYDRADYRSDAVILYGTQVENVTLFPEQAAFAGLWNQQHAYPRLRYSGFAEAMGRIGADQGEATRAHRGDGGPYWEDGLAANARITALARLNMRRVLSAEIFSTAASLVNPASQPDGVMFRQAWENLWLTDEHTWHADVSTSDPESQQSRRQGAAKDARAEEASQAIDHLLGRAQASLADSIPAPPGTLVVFNSLNWARDGWVETDLPAGRALVDTSSGEPVPEEALFSGAAFRHVRFLARAIPAVGYRCYRLLPQTSPAEPPVATNQSTVLENRFYRLTLDPASGGVRSLVDRELDLELVDTRHSFRLNQHLYVTGADALPNRLVQFSTVTPIPELEVHAAGGGRLVSVRDYPFGLVARLECTNLWHPRIETTVILSAHEKKVEFINRLEKLKVYSKEAAYFAFPFALEKPRFRYALQNGMVDPAKDLLPGAGREWFCVQDWVAVDTSAAAITWVPLDAPLATFGDIARGSWPSEFGARPGTVFSYAMNNYTPEGYQAGQGGDFIFRYALTSGRRFDPGAASRFGAGALTPLAVNEITRNDKLPAARGTLPPERSSFLSVVPENLNLVTWKRAEQGEEIILRLVETAGVSGSAEISSPLWTPSKAWRANAVEEKQAALKVYPQSVRFDFKPFEIVTIRVQAR